MTAFAVLARVWIVIRPDPPFRFNFRYVLRPGFEGVNGAFKSVVSPELRHEVSVCVDNAPTFAD